MRDIENLEKFKYTFCYWNVYQKRWEMPNVLKLCMKLHIQWVALEIGAIQKS